METLEATDAMGTMGAVAGGRGSRVGKGPSHNFRFGPIQEAYINACAMKCCAWMPSKR